MQLSTNRVFEWYLPVHCAMCGERLVKFLELKAFGILRKHLLQNVVHFSVVSRIARATHPSRLLSCVLHSFLIRAAVLFFLRHRSLSTHIENQLANFIIVACRWRIAHREGAERADDGEQKKSNLHLHCDSFILFMIYNIDKTHK